MDLGRFRAYTRRVAGSVLLVSTYELGHQPLQIAGPAAHLTAAGHEVDLLDTAMTPLSDARLAAADRIAISAPMHTALRLGVEVARRARRVAPDTPLCFFGLYATLNQAHLREAHGAEVLVGPPGPALLAWVEGGAPPSRDARRRFLVPHRDGLEDITRYVKLEHRGRARVAAAVEASRGCKYLCRHCPIPPVTGGRFVAVPAEVVLADVEALVARGVEHLTFTDPDFLNGPTHALRVARGIAERFDGLTFDITAKVEHLVRHRDAVGELAAAGCVMIVSAVESLEDPVLEILDKGHTYQDVMTALEVAREAQVALRPTFVPFTPWTSLEAYVALIEWIVTHDLVDHVDPVQLTVRLLVPPGSLLVDHPAFVPHRGALRPAELAYAYAHPDPRMDALQREVAALAARGGDHLFESIRGAAHAAAGDHDARWTRVIERRSEDVPRLTEPWFC